MAPSLLRRSNEIGAHVGVEEAIESEACGGQASERAVCRKSDISIILVHGDVSLAVANSPEREWPYYA